MKTHVGPAKKTKNLMSGKNVGKSQKGANSTFQFVDNRSETTTQKKLSEMANNSQQNIQTKQLFSKTTGGTIATIQKQGPEEEELMQGKFKPIQKMEEEELMQGKFIVQRAPEDEEELMQGKFVTQLKENKTGLPDNLKSGVENLSGHSLDDVKVHYNSNKPAQLNAHAYAQGTDIHMAPGQEKHLPHEAWHVAQQKQGRVKPTTQMKGNVNVNDDPGLENEADVMGAKAINTGKALIQRKQNESQIAIQSPFPIQAMPLLRGIIQRNLNTKGSADGDKVDGEMANVREEVNQVIARKQPGEMVDDIGKLETSIASRKKEQSGFKDTNTEKYKSHAARIDQEQQQLTRLQKARAIELANRAPKKKKPKADASGWTTV